MVHDNQSPRNTLINRRGTMKRLGAGAALMALTFAPQVFAHHSWQALDTKHAYYLSGTIEDVRWGNPHVEITLRLGQRDLPAGWAQRALPPGADETDGRLSMASARPYLGREDKVRLTLAPPDWMAKWGLTRRLEAGERIEAVAFKGKTGNDEFRPVMFWVASGQGVWQKLLSFPDAPEPAPAGRQGR